tara:strand:- start:792 stop:917 length:126 start_codon:yes stop_codon:yes gene_type:complete
MDEDVGKNSDDTISKIVWGVIYFIGFLMAGLTILDILVSLF